HRDRSPFEWVIAPILFEKVSDPFHLYLHPIGHLIFDAEELLVSKEPLKSVVEFKECPVTRRQSLAENPLQRSDLFGRAWLSELDGILFVEAKSDVFPLGFDKVIN
ncbi:MAG TPA: hypothetical protein VGX70_19755, partial [Gemmataceae bacterium]|nr:hypothetical protein [Gemmataceae bacterium]